MAMFTFITRMVPIDAGTRRIRLYSRAIGVSIMLAVSRENSCRHGHDALLHLGAEQLHGAGIRLPTAHPRRAKQRRESSIVWAASTSVEHAASSTWGF